MKVLSSTKDVLTIGLNDGQKLLVKENEVVIINTKGKRCKVGYTDAFVISEAMKTVFATELKELNELRKKIKSSIPIEMMSFRTKFPEDYKSDGV